MIVQCAYKFFVIPAYHSAVGIIFVVIVSENCEKQATFVLYVGIPSLKLEEIASLALTFIIFKCTVQISQGGVIGLVTGGKLMFI